MELEEGCYFLDNDFDQFRSLDLLSSAIDNSYAEIDSAMGPCNEQLADFMKSLDFGLDSKEKIDPITDDFAVFDAGQFDNDLGSHLFCNDSSPATSDSGSYSPACSTAEDHNPFELEQINIPQPVQIHQLETKPAAVPDLSRLVPVQIPLKKIVTNGSSIPNTQVICVVPARTNHSPVKMQPCFTQIKQRRLSPKRELPSPAKIFFNNIQPAVIGPANNVCSSLPNVKIASPKALDNIRDDYDRKKENRRIKNRYSAQLSRIRKRNEIEEMKRNLAAKDVTIENLRKENHDLKKTVEILRKENEELKLNGKNQNNNGRLGVVAGATFLFAVVSLFSFSSTFTKNLDPTRDGTSLIALNPAASDVYSSKSKVRTSRALLSFDYDGSSDYTSNERPLLKPNILSQPNLNGTANCDNVQKKYLNETEAMRLNDDVFAWVNRHECLQFMRIRRIFRVPLHSTWETPTMDKSVAQETTRGSQAMNKENRRRRTAIDKIEAARMQAVRERTWRHIDMISSGGGDNAATTEAMKPQMEAIENNAINSWGQRKTDALAVLNMESQYAELARNLKQREDTFYVVAMKDYYLLPPTDRNGTMQPHLSLILPALSFNGTLPNQIAMMRLECDITGTGLFHLPSSLLPLFFDRSSRQ